MIGRLPDNERSLTLNSIAAHLTRVESGGYRFHDHEDVQLAEAYPSLALRASTSGLHVIR